MADPFSVVVGLGNPGPRYERTRHNVGFRLLDRLARETLAGRERREGDCAVAWARMGRERVALVRPLLLMNRSGDALASWPEWALVEPDRRLIAFDDVALPFGALRLRREGSAGGHRGLASVLDRLGTTAVPRLRMGIAGGEAGRDLRDYVLEAFSEEEEAAIGPWLDRAVECVRIFLAEGADAAMNRFNR